MPQTIAERRPARTVVGGEWIGSAADRKESQPEAETELEDQREPELRHRINDGAPAADDPIPPGVAPGAGEDAESDSEDRGEGQADAREQQRPREGVRDGVKRRTMLQRRVAKVTARDVDHV